MQEINEAFEHLRKVVPQFPSKSGANDNTKLTKITTLRLAVNYIAALTQILKQTDNPNTRLESHEAALPMETLDPIDLLEAGIGTDDDSCPGLLDDAFDLILESDGDSMPMSDDINV